MKAFLKALKYLWKETTSDICVYEMTELFGSDTCVCGRGSNHWTKMSANKSHCKFKITCAFSYGTQMFVINLVSVDCIMNTYFSYYSFTQHHQTCLMRWDFSIDIFLFSSKFKNWVELPYFFCFLNLEMTDFNVSIKC